MASKKEVKVANAPQWFYYASILAAFLFMMYISIYATIHFNEIKYMNYVVVFMSLAIVSFFLISLVYFFTERKGYHAFAPFLFLIGIVSIIFYAFKASDASNIVRYSVIYTIVILAISTFVLMPKMDWKPKKPAAKLQEAQKPE